MLFIPVLIAFPLPRQVSLTDWDSATHKRTHSSLITSCLLPCYQGLHKRPPLLCYSMGIMTSPKVKFTGLPFTLRLTKQVFSSPSKRPSFISE